MHAYVIKLAMMELINFQMVFALFVCRSKREILWLVGLPQLPNFLKVKEKSVNFIFSQEKMLFSRNFRIN